MRRRNSEEVPPELQTYDSERWAAEAAAMGEDNGSLRYYAALRRAGVRDDIAHMMRAAACVQELKAACDNTSVCMLDAEGRLGEKL